MAGYAARIRRMRRNAEKGIEQTQRAAVLNHKRNLYA